MLKKFLTVSCFALLASHENYAHDNILSRINMGDNYQSPFGAVPKQVAVVDSGYARDNDELQGVLDRGKGFYARQNLSTESMTQSAVLTESIVQNPSSPGYNKHSSHGSHVAGLAAQGFGDVTHLAKDGVFKPVVPVKISLNHTDTQNFVDALNTLKNNSDVAVINLSWRFNKHEYGLDQKLEQAMLDVMAAGKIIVLAAGNDSVLYGTTTYTRSVTSLAEKANGRLLIVGASNWSNEAEHMANFSNLSSNISAPYYVTAPGQDLESFVPKSISPNGKALKSGTSMAAPIVAGVLTRLITDFPQLTVDEISKIFRDTARKQYKQDGSVYNRFGCGIIDVNAAREIATTKVLEKEASKPVVVQPMPVVEPINVAQPLSTSWLGSAWNAVSSVGSALKDGLQKAVQYVDNSRVGYAFRQWWYK